MRDTTSERQIDGPAIIMSHKGAELFFEFIKTAMGLSASSIGNVGIDGGNEGIDDFLRNYDEYTAGNKPTATRSRTARDYGKEIDALTDIMFGKGEMSLNEIWQAMCERGFWSGDSKQATGYLMDVANMFKSIVRVRRGKYQMILPDRDRPGEEGQHGQAE